MLPCGKKKGLLILKYLRKICTVFIAAVLLLSAAGVMGNAQLNGFEVTTTETVSEENVMQPVIADEEMPQIVLDENTVYVSQATVPDNDTEEDPVETKAAAVSAVNPDPYVSSHYHVTDFDEIFFDEMFPSYLAGATSWDPMGMDDNGIIYFGYTCDRTDLGLEDFAVFSYNPEINTVKFLGSFIDASQAAGNYVSGESIPKGHTKFYCIDNKMYMASQSFHDFKEGIGDLYRYRGAHLYCYDIEKQVLLDLSASMPDGVWCEHEGVVAMNYMEETGMLVGFTHPHANLVFYDLAAGTVGRFVTGIPWTLGNPLSREIIIVGDKVYLYRGVETTGNGAQTQYPVYVYDYSDDVLSLTGYTMMGGFWNGQDTTDDDKTTYISGCAGYLYKLDRETGTFTFLCDMDAAITNTGSYFYSITLSPDESKLFYIPTATQTGMLIEYDIATNTICKIASPTRGVYCGSAIRSGDWYYFTRFGTAGNGYSWNYTPSVVRYKIEPQN